MPEELLANSQRAVAATIAQVLEANQRLFNEERDKLERWADDKLLAAEEALKNTKARIAQLKRDARKAVTFTGAGRHPARTVWLERNNDVCGRKFSPSRTRSSPNRDELIACPAAPAERTSNETLFSVRWQVT